MLELLLRNDEKIGYKVPCCYFLRKHFGTEHSVKLKETFGRRQGFQICPHPFFRPLSFPLSWYPRQATEPPRMESYELRSDGDKQTCKIKTKASSVVP